MVAKLKGCNAWKRNANEKIRSESQLPRDPEKKRVIYGNERLEISAESETPHSNPESGDRNNQSTDFACKSFFCVAFCALCAAIGRLPLDYWILPRYFAKQKKNVCFVFLEFNQFHTIQKCEVIKVGIFIPNVFRFEALGCVSSHPSRPFRTTCHMEARHNGV